MNVSTQHAKLMGFSPRYVWEALLRAHARTAKRIRRETAEVFIDMEDLEMKIREIVEGILQTDGLDLDSFVTKATQARRMKVEKVRKEIAAEISQQRREQFGQRVEPEDLEQDGSGCEDEDEDEDYIQLMRNAAEACSEGRCQWAVQLAAQKAETEKWRSRYLALREGEDILR